MALLPGVANGVLLKSTFPSSDVYAESGGCTLDVRRRFNQSWHCSSSSSYNCAGKSLSVVQSPDIRWLLNVCIALSTTFLLCIPGGMSSKVISSVQKVFFNSSEISLSRT